MKHNAGVVLTLHPYGKDMKVNYHIHALVTEGGMDKNGRWRSQPFIRYESLRNKWKYEVLIRLREEMPDEYEYIKLINDLFMRYKNGFYVNAESKVKDGKGIGKYIGRYLRHPAIADSQIVSYDGESITFRYKDRSESGKTVLLTKKVPVLEFIHDVIRHIPPKQFKMVRYYGLYAPRKKEKVKQLMQQIGSMLGRAICKLTWRERRIRTFGQDPLTCWKCGLTDMVLYSLTIPDGHGLKTIGGRSWLYARGDWIESPPDSDLPSSQSSSPPPVSTNPHPSPVQLTFAFPVAA
ncbi:MAG: transposase [Chloroflexota bacterium]